jgi:hypothetical protein
MMKTGFRLERHKISTCKEQISKWKILGPGWRLSVWTWLNWHTGVILSTGQGRSQSKGYSGELLLSFRSLLPRDQSLMLSCYRLTVDLVGSRLPVLCSSILTPLPTFLFSIDYMNSFLTALSWVDVGFVKRSADDMRSWKKPSQNPYNL